LRIPNAIRGKISGTRGNPDVRGEKKTLLSRQETFSAKLKAGNFVGEKTEELKAISRKQSKWEAQTGGGDGVVPLGGERYSIKGLGWGEGGGYRVS